MVDSSEQSFEKLRFLLWPIYRYELKKLIAMLIIAFLVPFNYSILRNIKDTVVITAVGSGAEVIPFIKVWVMLPMAIIVTWIFTKLASRFKREHVFYIMVSSFIGYFLIFAFLLYPHQEVLQPIRFCDFLRRILPSGSSGFIAMVQNWNCTFFYTVAELWSSVVLSILFWGFANDITTLKQAKRFYGTLNVASCLAAIAAGRTSIFCSLSQYNPNIPFGTTEWEQTFNILILVVSVSAFVMMATYRWIHVYVLPDPKQGCTHALESKQTIKNKKKLCLKESLRNLGKSKYLICLAVMVVAYNIGINLIEVTWKSTVRELYPTAKDFHLYLNNITFYMGVLSTIIAFFIPFIVSRIGWTFMALITPLVMLVTAVGFFGFNLCDTTNFVSIIGLSPLVLTVFFGSANNVLSKASKYSVFDASKEMSFIPLSKEERIRGKATIDGIGSRLGKSGGSLIQQGLLLCVGSLAAAMPWTAGFLGIIIVVWICAVVALGRKFKIFSFAPEKKKNDIPAEVIPDPV